MPGERMKMRADHTVPLSSLALSILDKAKELRTHDGTDALLFPGFTRAGPLSENAILALLARAGYFGRQTGHGFRAAFSTWANEAGADPTVIELCLAHQQGGVRGIYNRGGYVVQRKKLLDAWGKHLLAQGCGCHERSPTAEPKPPAGKSRSVRAKAHDWASLLQVVSAYSLDPVIIDYDERYVHAIQTALEGRDNAPLLDLLDGRGGTPHPALLPVLADVIRSQRDSARGAGGEALDHVQDLMIRDVFDKWTSKRTSSDGAARQFERVGYIRQWLADQLHVSLDTINRSLKRTASAK